MSENKRLRYIFDAVEVCEMCGDSTEKHRILGQRLNQSQGFSPKSKSGISVSVKQCTNCDLIYPSPLPIPFDLQDHYGTPPEDYWKPEYFVVDKEYYTQPISVTKELIAFREGMCSLDVGAGIGKCMLALANAGFDSFGVEPSQPFYDRAISKMGIVPDKLKFGKVEDVDFPENFFDFITYGAVFEHLYHPAECLKRTLKWLKPNGIIHIEVPSTKYLMAKVVNLYYKFRGTTYVNNISPMHVPFHLYEFSVKSFEEMGKSAGFTVERFQHEVCRDYIVPASLQKIFIKLMRATDTGMLITLYLRKNS